MYIWRSWWHFALFIQLFLILFLRALSLIIPKLRLFLRERIEFESKNSTFTIKCNNPHVFHVSSEGEFSQISPMISDLLIRNFEVLLLYTSPSVEDRINKFSSVSNHFISRRLVLTKSDLSFLLSLKPKSVSLCRYDFFPWLMILGLRSPNFYLLNATSVKWRNGGYYNLLLRKCFYSQFDLITVSNQMDNKVFKKLLPHKDLIKIDLRSKEVIIRQNNFYREYFTAKKVSYLHELSNSAYNICFGSAWAQEITVFDSAIFQQFVLKMKPAICIFPHLLDKHNVCKISEILQRNDLSVRFINNFEELNNISITDGVVNVFLVKGILCEMYPFFNNVIIGGGFGVSVHSVLEPMLANCNTFCGPNVQRSTEVENFVEYKPKKIHICHSIKDLAADIVKKFEVNDNNKLLDIKTGEAFLEQKKQFDNLKAYYKN